MNTNENSDPRAIWESLTPAQLAAFASEYEGLVWSRTRPPLDAMERAGLVVAVRRFGRGEFHAIVTDKGRAVANVGRALAIRSGDIGNVVPAEQAKLEAWASDVLDGRAVAAAGAEVSRG